MLPRLISLFFCLGFFLFGCHRESGVAPPISPQGPSHQSVSSVTKRARAPYSHPEEKLPETEFRHLHYVVYEEGRRKWQVEALRVQIYQGREIEMEKITVVSGDRDLTITADRGIYRVKPERFLFEGHVRLETAKHGCLETARLVYLPRKELLQTSCPVRITNRGIVMEGKGFVYDLRTGTLKILHQTKVRVEG